MNIDLLHPEEITKAEIESIIWNLAFIDRFDDKTAIRLVKQITKNFDK
tara:strand:- start:128 stop:271 length:144 start_codon:yes stop_codon:yes gene_type:complete